MLECQFTVKILINSVSSNFDQWQGTVVRPPRGKLVQSERIKLPDGRKIRSIGEKDDGYKYLGLMEVNDIMHEVTKTNTKKEHTRNVKENLTLILKGGNAIKAINS